MAGYQLESNARLPDEIRRIVLEQIDGASEQLQQRQPDLHEAVHEARKSFKKIRAVLRLVRSELGSAYKVEIAFYRDLGAELSSARDVQAMVECWEKLRKRFHRAFSKGRFAEAERALHERRAALEADDSVLASKVAEVLTKLAAARERIQRWPLSSGDFDAAAPGFRQIYDRGRKAYRAAYREPSPENFHEWRKRVKDHWYHVRLLEGIWPDVMKGHKDALTRLAEDLGDHHDLVVLAQTIRSDSSQFGTPESVDALLHLIENRRIALEKQSDDLGAKVYAERPEEITRRFRRYWRAGRG